jgi:hypothetical protein
MGRETRFSSKRWIGFSEDDGQGERDKRSNQTAKPSHSGGTNALRPACIAMRSIAGRTTRSTLEMQRYTEEGGVTVTVSVVGMLDKNGVQGYRAGARWYALFPLWFLLFFT